MEITKELKEMISEKSGVEVDKIALNSHFQDDLNISKLELADILTLLEDEYQINFRKEDIKEIETFGDLETLVKDHLNEI